MKSIITKIRAIFPDSHYIKVTADALETAITEGADAQEMLVYCNGIGGYLVALCEHLPEEAEHTGLFELGDQVAQEVINLTLSMFNKLEES